MSIKDFLLSVQKVFTSKLYTEQEKKYILKLLVCEYYGINKAKLILIESEEASLALMKYLEKQVIRLNHNEPIQYILGKENFYGYDFMVNEHVLIPRPETEELVDWILKETKAKESLNILDIGTGSGCIPISIKKARIDFKVKAIDISKEALDIAIKNSEILDADVTFILLNILDETQWNKLKLFDVIISNPPYIPQSEKELMEENVLNYEPHLALFVEEDEPLIFYKKIAKFAMQNLKQNGLLFFECNEYNALNVKDYLVAMGFKNIVLKKDINGKPRMIKANRI